MLTTFNNICDACGFLPELSINSFHLRHVDTFFNRPWNLFIVQLIFFIVQDAGGLRVTYPYPQSTNQTILLAS
jgi:hypothetical protein